MRCSPGAKGTDLSPSPPTPHFFHVVDFVQILSQLGLGVIMKDLKRLPFSLGSKQKYHASPPHTDTFILVISLSILPGIWSSSEV